MFKIMASSTLYHSVFLKLILSVSLIILGLGLLGSPVAQAQVVPPPPTESSPYDAETFRIADQLQCPVCQGVTVAYSNSGLAQQMRVLIKKKLEQGENQEQILQYFVERYGEGILTTPPKQGLFLLVWLLPIAALLVGVVIVTGALKNWRPRRYQSKITNPDLEIADPSIALTEVPVSPEIFAEYEERVERELALFNQPTYQKVQGKAGKRPVKGSGGQA